MSCFILGPDTRPRAVIDGYKRLTWTRRYYGFGSFEMTVPLHCPGAQEIQRGRILAPLYEGRIDAVFAIERIQIAVNERGHGSEDMQVAGRTLTGIFTQRVCVPPAGLAHDEREGPAETVMKGYVLANVVQPADPRRALPWWAVAPDLGRGSHVAFAARYHYLSTVLEQLGRVSGLGYDVQADSSQHRWVFDVVRGANRSVGNSLGNDPVILSPDLGTAQTQRYLADDIDSPTWAYVLGQNEGADRQVVEVGLEPDLSGWARREIAIDARDQYDLAALAARGRAKLAERGPLEALEAELYAGSRLRYRHEFDLGDIVTVHNREWGVQANLRITEITVTLEESRSYPQVRLGLEAV